MNPSNLCKIFPVVFALAISADAAIVIPVPDKVSPVVVDRQDATPPNEVKLTGWLGGRIAVNESNRLVKLDPIRLLEGYRKRPGRQSWDGEHVGKWLHAATLAWVNTGDPALREKLDYVAAELVKCQMEDGYLGTYLEKDRWTEWDVWAHKYNLIGLLTYMRWTGNLAPLPACKKMGDLLCNTFGDADGKRDIIKAGHHMGMAPTSVLEPMVLLYRFTGEARYLDFCKYILRAWEQPNGPKIVSTLMKAGRVDKVGNAKAYEMLSCLNGALEYYRTVGDAQIFEACKRGWQDIVDNRLYITGAASYEEFFHDNFDFPNVRNVGETCVTVTWIQFNAQLLRLTDEAKYAEQLEHVVLNQLLGAQQCDGAGWGYYVQMEGKKPYSSTLDGHCCLSSGPRGLALVPTFALATDADGVVVNLFDAAEGKLKLRDGLEVGVTIDTKFPAEEQVRVRINPSRSGNFTVKLRPPLWCPALMVKVNGGAASPAAGEDGYLAIKREWKAGDEITLEMKLMLSLVPGEYGNLGKVAFTYGPLVLAADEALWTPAGSPSSPPPFKSVGIGPSNLNNPKFAAESATGKAKSWSGAQVFRVNGVTRRGSGLTPERLGLVPFADAGATGSRYEVWVPIEATTNSGSVLLAGTESRSRNGNQAGSTIDDDPANIVVTYDGRGAAEDWYAVALEKPARLERVVFVHGRTFHDGGWFDASAGKPRVQIKAAADGEWLNAGEIKDYPATTATSAAGLKDGERFTIKLQGIPVVAVRLIGRPAHGDNPAQAFSSCGELQAFAVPGNSPRSSGP